MNGRMLVSVVGIAVLVVLLATAVAGAFQLVDRRAEHREKTAELRRLESRREAMQATRDDRRASAARAEQLAAAERKRLHLIKRTKAYQATAELESQVARAETRIQQLKERRDALATPPQRAATTTPDTSSQSGDVATCRDWMVLPADDALLHAERFARIAANSLQAPIGSYELSVAITTACKDAPDRSLTDVVTLAAALLATD
jgi:hypothetical protein